MHIGSFLVKVYDYKSKNEKRVRLDEDRSVEWMVLRVEQSEPNSC